VKKKKNRRDDKLNTILTETTEHGEVPVDVYQKLAEDRILFICDHINDKMATDIVATLLLKDAENCDEKITIFINSGGGDIRSVLMIYDIMQLINSPIETVCIGSAMDAAAIILSSGNIGNRFATKNAIISISQLEHDWTSMSDMTDAKNHLEQGVLDNKRIMEIFSKNTNKSIKQIMEDFDRRVFMNTNQAIKYGFIDKMAGISK